MKIDVKTAIDEIHTRALKLLSDQYHHYGEWYFEDELKWIIHNLQLLSDCLEAER